MRDGCANSVSVRRLDALTSPGFIIALSLLLLNDFALKALFHNWLTGKVSDFAGLFIFPLFWSTLFPRFRRAIYFLTAISFLFWKSAYSQFLIDAWNGLAILPVGRTVDATDLLALTVLPLSFTYYEYRAQENTRGLAPYFIAGLSLFAFTATSFRTEFSYDNKYHFQMSQTELTRRVFNLHRLNKEYRVDPCGFTGITPDKLEVDIPSDFCFSHVGATIGIGEEQGRGVITLKKMKHECPEGRNDKQKLLSIFEKEFIGKLSQASPVFLIDELPESPTPSRPDKAGQLYLVPIGEPPDVGLQTPAGYLRREYGAKVQVLRSLPLTAAARDPRFPSSRPQAERLVEYMRSEYQKVASNPDAVMIGITRDMYVEGAGEYYPSHYVRDGKLAVISLDGLNPTTFCEPADGELLQNRLRKLLGKLYRESTLAPA
jgi:hypothetical protein